VVRVRRAGGNAGRGHQRLNAEVRKVVAVKAARQLLEAGRPDCEHARSSAS
jgi:hypothetical protein